MSDPSKVSVNSNVLSRNSSRSYKAKILRSSAELNKTLKELDREFNTNMTKILNEKYELQKSEELKRSETFPRRTRPEKYLRQSSVWISEERLSAKDDQSIDCESEFSVGRGTSLNFKDEMWQSFNVKPKIFKDGSEKQLCHLPSIIEERCLKTKQSLSSGKSNHTLLPPLPSALVCHPVVPDNFNEVGPLPRRRVSESNVDFLASQRVLQESKNTLRHRGKLRQRSSTFSVACSDSSVKKRSLKSSATQPDDAITDARSDIDWEREQVHRRNGDSQLKTAWDEDLANCRYIRSRSCSSPDVLDVESVFGSASGP